MTHMYIMMHISYIYTSILCGKAKPLCYIHQLAKFILQNQPLELHSAFTASYDLLSPPSKGFSLCPCCFVMFLTNKSPQAKHAETDPRNGTPTMAWHTSNRLHIQTTHFLHTVAAHYPCAREHETLLQRIISIRSVLTISICKMSI